MIYQRVIREIFGAKVDGGGDPLALGDFTFYDFQAHVDRIQLIPTVSADPFWSGSFWVENHGVLVECTVEARDEEKASALADILFNRLDYALRVLMGLRGEHLGLGALNAVRVSQDQFYILSDAGASSSSGRKGMPQPIRLSTPFFFELPAQKLWKILCRPKNDLERRLVRCVEWLGQAILEKSVPSAIVKCATALESLLALQEKGLINASIASSISETSAHILGDSAHDALNIERQVKDLYGMRWAIVHSGGEGGAESDLARFIDIVRAIILRLLTDERFIHTTSIGAIYARFRELKYAHREGTVSDGAS